jgi:hypothetical protein
VRSSSARSDILALRRALEFVHVVPHIERTSIDRAKSLGRVGGDVVAAAGTLEKSDLWHTLLMLSELCSSLPLCQKPASALCAIFVTVS